MVEAAGAAGAAGAEWFKRERMTFLSVFTASLPRSPATERSASSIARGDECGLWRGLEKDRGVFLGSVQFPLSFCKRRDVANVMPRHGSSLVFV